MVLVSKTICLLITLVLSSVASPDVAADDIDDLRVSSVSRFDGNYHTLTPAIRAKVSRDDIGVNQIGKPLYMQTPSSPTLASAAAAVSSQQQQQQQPAQQRQAQAPSGAKKLSRPAAAVAAKPTQAPAKFVASDIDIDDDLMLRAPDLASFHSQNTCRWIPLKDLRNINFDTGELIIRDATEQPCYIMSLRAFIKFNDDAYFPLRNFRPYPKGAYKIEHFNRSSLDSETASSGASGIGPYRMAWNCSLPDSAPASAAFLTLAHDQRPSDYYLFKEEITVQLDCGYLVFKLKLDYAYQLLLEAISFYQDEDAVAAYRAPTSAKVMKGKGQERTASKATRQQQQQTLNRPVTVKPATMQSEHLVFSTSSSSTSGTTTTTASSDSSPSPLVVMPLYSRYICNNRIVLTGANSIQLVIDKFEFNRLVTAPADKVRAHLKHRAHLHALTKCPDLVHPATNLTGMMASTSRGADETGEKPSSATSNKLTSTKSSAAKLERLSVVLQLASLLVTLHWVRKVYSMARN